MELVYKSGQMERNIKENGNIIKPMEKGSLLTQMVILMMEIGKTIWQMVMEFISILMEQNMKDNGSMINNMDTVLKFGQMGHLIKDSFKTVLNMEKVNYILKMR